MLKGLKKLIILELILWSPFSVGEKTEINIKRKMCFMLQKQHTNIKIQKRHK